MKRALLAAIVTAAALPVTVFAQTCANPISLHPQGQNVTFSGTTCGGQAGIPLGGAVQAHPSVVYQFTYNNNEIGGITISGAEREVVIATDCNSAPLTGGAVGGTLNLPGTPGITNGQNYLLIVTSDAGLPTTTPPRCGDFTVGYVALPVSLQSFSVE